MSRRRDVRASLEIGEIGPDWLRRADAEIHSRACKRARNVILKAGGGLGRRPGSNMLATLTGQSRLFSYHGRTGVEHLVFGNARVDIYDAAGSLSQSITSSCPWVTADLARLKFTMDANKVFVAHENFIPQVLTRASGGTWSRADFEFLTGPNSNPSQPFYADFDPIDVAIAVNAYSGTGRTLTFSQGGSDYNFLTADWVGVRFRYLTACEMEVTAVVDGHTATVTIHDELYPTLDITVADSSGYRVGEVCNTTISQLRGLVISKPSGTSVRLLMLDGYDYPEVITTAGVDKDKVVGQATAQEVTAVSLVGTPTTTTIWDEQLMSDARGWPSNALVHRNRLFFTGFPQATDTVICSSVGNFYDLSVSAVPEGGINERLGDDPNAEIRHLVSAEQLLAFTDRGVYYVPEGGENIISGDEGLTFLKVGPEGCSYAEPVVASEGVLFIDEDASRLMAVAPTGNVRRSWTPVELSEYGFHLISSPVRLAVSNGLDARSERYVYVLNSDGTMATMMYRRNSELVGFSKWYRGTGTWEDITSIEDDVFTVSKVGSAYRLCQFDFSAQSDDETAYTSAVTARDGDTCVVVKTLQCVGSGVVGATTTGLVDGFTPAAGYTLGYGFERIVEPTPYFDPRVGWVRYRITRSTVEVTDSGVVRVGSRVSWPFNAIEDLEVVGKTSSRTIRAFVLGHSATADPVITIKQEATEGAEFNVVTVTNEVAF